MDLEEEHEQNPENPEDIVIDSDSEDSIEAVFPISEIQAHSDSVCSVAFHPISPDIYASGGIDDIAFFYTQNEAKELTGHTDSIIAVSFSNCGEFLAVASMDGTITIWNAQNGDNIAKYEGPTEEILSISWHPRLPSLCALSNDLSLWVWHTRKNSPVAVIYGHPLNIAKFGPAGRYIYAGGKDGSIKVWDMKSEGFENAPPLCTIPGKDIHNDEIISIDMHNGGIIVSGSKDGCVGLTNFNSKKIITKIKVCEESIESVEFCKEMMWFLVATMSGELRVYECDSLNTRCTIQVGMGIVKAIWVGFDIYVGGLEGLLELYDGRGGQRVKKFSGTKETVLDFDVKQ